MEKTGLNITMLKDGSHGGDMELGALIANKKLDYLIFFWDPLRVSSPRRRRQSPSQNSCPVQHPNRV